MLFWSDILELNRDNLLLVAVAIAEFPDELNATDVHDLELEFGTTAQLLPKLLV